MLIKTHLAITIFVILAVLSNVEPLHRLVFVVVALIATFIPDIDSGFSSFGKRKTFKIFQFFLKHRGLFHSFSFLLLATLFFVLFIPVIALPLFLGYGFHLLADSFTIEGIKPFYPFKKKIYGKLKTGSFVETGVFVFFVLADLLLFAFKFVL